MVVWTSGRALGGPSYGAEEPDSVPDVVGAAVPADGVFVLLGSLGHGVCDLVALVHDEARADGWNTAPLACEKQPASKQRQSSAAVFIVPLTRTPSGPKSTAISRVMPMMPVLTVSYPTEFRAASMPWTLAQPKFPQSLRTLSLC